jgi:hypothetical protein
LPWELIRFYSDRHGLEDKHVAACILTESQGDQYTARYEPNFRYLYFPRDFAKNLNISYETEEVLQKTSWGYMQPMGAIARELGFHGMITMLIEPKLNLDTGCHKMKLLSQKYGNIKDVIAAYNAGSVRKTDGGLYVNQKHVDRFDFWLRKVTQ